VVSKRSLHHSSPDLQHCLQISCKHPVLMGDNTSEPEGEVAGATAESDKNAMSSKDDEHTTSEATDPDGGTKGEESSEVDGESPEKGFAEDEIQTLADTEKQNGKAEVAAAEDTASEKAKEDNHEKEPAVVSSSSVSVPIVSSSKKSRPPYKYDPEKITLRFLFANRDGLTVTIECRPGDTVGEVKGALLSVWPSGM
jgi:hypothetical protein